MSCKRLKYPTEEVRKGGRGRGLREREDLEIRGGESAPSRQDSHAPLLNVELQTSLLAVTSILMAGLEKRQARERTRVSTLFKSSNFQDYSFIVFSFSALSPTFFFTEPTRQDLVR